MLIQDFLDEFIKNWISNVIPRIAVRKNYGLVIDGQEHYVFIDYSVKFHNIVCSI